MEYQLGVQQTHFQQIIFQLPSFLKTKKLHLYKNKIPIFDNDNIENEISKSLKNKVWLKSGAYLIIDHTEAMVVIDVNSGRFIGKKVMKKIL